MSMWSKENSAFSAFIHFLPVKVRCPRASCLDHADGLTDAGPSQGGRTGRSTTQAGSTTSYLKLTAKRR